MTVRLIGGPATMIEIGRLRLLTDPTVDSQGCIAIGNQTMTKRQPPAVPVDEVGPIDAVLSRLQLVMTTVAGAARLGAAARVMPPWYHLGLPRRDGDSMRITGVPARTDTPR